MNIVQILSVHFLLLSYFQVYSESVCESVCDNDDDSIVVTTDLGEIEGFFDLGTEKGNVHAYLGIPYAQPPIGNLRFRKPEPIKPWNERLDATRKREACLQSTASMYLSFGLELQNLPSKSDLQMSEDCLFLNIWTPDSRKPSSKPVLVYLHSGLYRYGSTTTDQLDGARLASEANIVVVTVQYRLGTFGFLCTPYENIGECNMGLWDQNMALNWVRSHIHNFGGNNESITLFGNEAGAVSSILQMISPISREQLNLTRAILHSGALNARWTFVKPLNAYTNSLNILHRVGCIDDETLKKFPKEYKANHTKINNKTITNCVQTISGPVMLGLEFDIQRKYLQPTFAPTIDDDFLPKDPNKLLEEIDLKDYSFMIGSNEDAASQSLLRSFMPFFYKGSNGDEINITNHNFLIDEIFDYFLMHHFSMLIPRYYAKKKGHEKEFLVQMATDYFFTCPVMDLAKKLVNAEANTYYYIFDHHKSKSHQKWPAWMGVVQGDEMDFFFGDPINHKRGYNTKEHHLSTSLMTMLKNFVYLGKPTKKEIKWHKLVKDPKRGEHYWEPYFLSGDGRRKIEQMYTSRTEMRCFFWHHHDKFVELKERWLKDPDSIKIFG